MCNKDLFFRDFGNGKPIIILHGIMGSSDIWIPTAQTLSKHNRIIIPDLPNHGNSFHNNSLAYDTTATEIEHFIADHNIERPIIIGHSYGGKVALNILSKKNIEIEKIILIDITSEEQKSSNMEKMFEILQHPLPLFSTFIQAKLYFENIISDTNMCNLLLKGLKRNGKNIEWRWNTDLLVREYNQILQAVELPNLCDTPLLLVKGDKSEYVTESGINILRKTFTNFTLANVADAGHWVHADNFDGFISAIAPICTQ